MAVRPFFSFRVAKYDPHNCDVCNISCNSNAIYETHITGKKHQKARKKLEKNQFKCDICDKICYNFDNWKKHQNSMEHTIKFQMNSVDQIRDRSNIIDSIDPLACNICKRKFDSNVILQSHLTGQRHKRKLRIIQLNKLKEIKDPTVYCEQCDLVLEPDIMVTHLNGHKHKKSTIIINKCLEHCPICEADFKTKEEAKQHYLTAEHKLKLHQKADTIFWCDVCKVQVYSSEVLNEHFEGFKHFMILNKNNDNPPESKFKERLVQKRQKLAEIKEKIEERRRRKSKESEMSLDEDLSGKHELNSES